MREAEMEPILGGSQSHYFNPLQCRNGMRDKQNTGCNVIH